MATTKVEEKQKKANSPKKKRVKSKSSKKIDELERKLKEKENSLLRAYSDFQNYRRRVDREIEERVNEAKRRFAEDLVDIYELMKKAHGDKNPEKGIDLIIKSIEKIFDREGIEPIDSIGKPFDHNIHHAVSTIEKKEFENNIVVDEIRKGYMIGDKLLRPSLVVVSKNNKKEG